MLHATIAALCLAAAPASNRSPDALWEAVYQLANEVQRPAAVAALGKAGPEGIALLAKVARTDPQVALQAARSAVHCGGVSVGISPVGGPHLAEQAAATAVRLLAGNLQLDWATLHSADPMARKLAIYAVSTDPALMTKALAELRREKDPAVLSTAAEAVQCTGASSGVGPIADQADALTFRLHAISTADECLVVSDAMGYLPHLLDGSYRVSGSSLRYSPTELRISVERPGLMSGALSPACALGLYDLLRAKGRFTLELLRPLMEGPGVTQKERDAAAERMIHDFERLRGDTDGTAVATALASAGYPAPRLVEVSPERPISSAELKAAVRQNQPGAQAKLAERIQCRGVTSGALSLLPFWTDPQAVSLALTLVASCPQARDLAAATLLRRGDARALSVLDPLLDQSVEKLSQVRALLGDPTFDYSALEAHLRALAPAHPTAQLLLLELHRRALGEPLSDGE